MLKKILMICCLLFASTSFADATADKDEFNRLYAQFNDLYANSEEIDPIIDVAEKIYKIAPKAYGDNHMNTAVVTYNLASLYDEKGKNWSNEDEIKAVELYKEYFKILDNLDISKDENYLDQYLKFTMAEYNALGDESKGVYSKNVIELAEKIDITHAKFADINYKVGIINVNRKRIYEAEKYFQQSLKSYGAAAGDYQYGIGQNLFWLAKIDLGTGHTDDATEKFLKSIEEFDKAGARGADLALVSHANLVQIYEDAGESDKATKHCIAASTERPTNFDRYVTPLYRKNPKYPSGPAKAGREGWAVLEFTINKEGFTENVKILESSSRNFEKTSIEAAEKYRYAPSVGDGKLVNTDGVRLRIEYRVR